MLTGSQIARQHGVMSIVLDDQTGLWPHPAQPNRRRGHPRGSRDTGYNDGAHRLESFTTAIRPWEVSWAIRAASPDFTSTLTKVT